jgi:hypothetical protein
MEAAVVSDKTKNTDRKAANAKRVEAINRYIDDLEDSNDGDLAKVERSASVNIILGSAMPVILCGAIVVLVALFMPHSGSVRGYDVVLYSDRAQAFVTTLPERVFTWLALVGGILLPIGTVFSRASLVAWVNWIVSGIGWFYGVLAIAMRQSRPPTEPGEGPSFGLVIEMAAMLIIFIALSTRLLRRGAVQKEIAARRRQEADQDEKTRSEQLVLRTGVAPVAAEEPTEIVDDRRGRAKARREARAARASGSEDSEGSTDSPQQDEEQQPPQD